MALTLTSTAKPPPGEQGSGYLCRADFADDDVASWTPSFRVVSDGPSDDCSPNPSDHPLTGGVWDYWSSGLHGTDPACGSNGGSQNDVQANGGQWIFNTGFEILAPRSLRINWKNALVSPGPDFDELIPNPAAPNLDAVIFQERSARGLARVPQQYDPDATVDCLAIRISCGNLFALGTTRHQVSLEIFSIGRNWGIRYLQPLYVRQDNPANPKVLYLTTVDPAGINDVALAELWHTPDIRGAKTKIIGTYRLPMTIIVRQTETQTR